MADMFRQKFENLYDEYLGVICKSCHKHCDGTYEIRLCKDAYGTYDDMYYISHEGYCNKFETQCWISLEDAFEEACELIEKCIESEK